MPEGICCCLHTCCVSVKLLELYMPTFINPQGACTGGLWYVLVLCVCVCLYVCLSVTTLTAVSLISRLKMRYIVVSQNEVHLWFSLGFPRFVTSELSIKPFIQKL